MFDLHGALLKKQEHECARLDAFRFRHRARTMRLLADWARSRLPAGGGAPDPGTLAEAVATTADGALLDDLHRHLEPAGVSRRQLDRRYERARAEAYQQLVAEFGDPNPHPLA
ncbi:hypothetical protein [Azospirillum halopraeferens]|uniref:hypothetical protein n=1 Tax=Azospirillum halopraeferens TaxID=34010 RepID=UPI000428DE57|nr:hypothetical protein [Azospirillum halopraeferens]